MAARPGFSQEPRKDDQTPHKQEVDTRLEQALSRKDALIITETHEIGVVPGSFGAQVKIEGVEVAIPAEALRIFGLRFTRSVVPQKGENQAGLIDFDELGALQNGLDEMIKAAERKRAEVEKRAAEAAAGPRPPVLADRQPPLDPVANPSAEAIFATRGGLRVGFVQRGREQTCFISVNGSSPDASIYFGSGALRYFRRLLAQGHEKLVALGAK